MNRSMGIRFAGFVIALTSLSPFASAQAPKAGEQNPAPRKVAILLFPNVELLDFAGPSEVFEASRDEAGKPHFEVYTVGLTKSPLKSQRILTVTPQYDPSDSPLPDILVIPGGGVRSLIENKPAMEFVKKVYAEKKIIMSVCNGASALAKIGALDGLEVTTHHGNLENLRRLAPKAKVLANRRYIDNDAILTTAGVTAGIDGALYLVSKLHGMDAANRCAVYMNYDHWHGLPKETLPDESEPPSAKSRKGRIYPQED